MTQNEHTRPLGSRGFRQHTTGTRTVQIFTVGTGHTHVAVRVKDAPTEYSKSHAFEDAALRDYAAQIERLEAAVPRATVILFRTSGRYYTTDEWRIPAGATGPADMDRSPDFRQLDHGPVLVESQEPWGYPHLLGVWNA